MFSLKAKTFFVLLSLLTVGARAEPLVIGNAAPTFVLQTINKDEVTQQNIKLSSYFDTTGNNKYKLVILSFYASYCEPCHTELSFLAALYESYRQRGLMVVMVAQDKDIDKIEALKNEAQQAKLKFPLAWDRFGIVSSRYNISSLPFLYLLSGDGKVLKIIRSYDGAASLQQIHEVVRQILEIPLDEAVPTTISPFLPRETQIPNPPSQFVPKTPVLK